MFGFCAADRHPSKRSAGTSSRNDITFDRQSRVTRISAPSCSIILIHLSSDSGQIFKSCSVSIIVLFDGDTAKITLVSVTLNRYRRNSVITVSSIDDKLS
ncbi:hypothetical protein DERF_003128 [Dermatophagoides farinae]|uniref:Uncharacterized protein n=1 Tax=Dermatophagoides farinae TaxID=6954 RepID=A0A922IEZ9_DERFA|nr:hypothetical protein DERF_003128 [Dermatophagoides farinae]